MMLSVRILSLNYNGHDLLRKYLPALVEAATRSSYRCAVSVIDNCSSDGSVEMLRREFSGVDVFVAPDNRVLCSYNDAARRYEEDILILMNNDIRVEPDFVDALVRPFEQDGSVFFVTPRCLSMADGSYEGNRTQARIRKGLFWASSKFEGYEGGIERPGWTFQGGFGAFDRSKFLELGGYDDLYLPGRLEDADLCFRAQKMGWKCLYEPDSVVHHEGGTSFHRKFGRQGTLVINWRNTFLFMFKNLSDRGYWVSFVLWLPVRLAHSLMTFRPEVFMGFVTALPHIGRALERRRKLRNAGMLTRIPDREIFLRVSS